MRNYRMADPAVPFGRAMRTTHFSYAETYIPLNHGSYGATPAVIREYQHNLQDEAEARPDPFIRNSLPRLLNESRAAIAPLLGTSIDEVVFVPNATTGVNTVLRNLVYEIGDVILSFSTLYPAIDKTIDYVCETTLAESICVVLEYPLEDADIVQKFFDAVSEITANGRRAKIAMFDTVTTFPGVRMPWEALVKACAELHVLSLIDGAHGVGHIDLTQLGKISPDFFTSNCYK
jgi:selenocysteine lyase/cysteine desulfurase